MPAGIEDWVFGYVGEKLADKILSMFRTDKFSSDLHAAVDQWSKKLPSGSRLATTEALFPSYLSDSELEDRQNLIRLRSTIRGSVAPTSADWRAALIEQWQHVREHVQDPQAFFTLSESEAAAHLDDLANQLAVVCAQHEPLFRSTAMNLLREILSEIKECHHKTDTTGPNDRLLTEDHKTLLQRLYEFDGRCGIWAAKGEYECLWVPGPICDMQWGWERTAGEAQLSGKEVGDRAKRLHWIYVVESLVEGGLLQAVAGEKGLFELTKQGWRVAHELLKE